MKILILLPVLASVTASHAQTYPPILIEKAGCILKASAYLDPSRLPDSKNDPASRYDLELFQPAGDRYHWDFTLPEDSSAYPAGVSGAYGADYKTQTQATIRATLRQFDTYEERVTFKNLDLMPLVRSVSGDTARFLDLKTARSLTTPSGITVTLPAQQVKNFFEMFANFNGNADALFARIEVTPSSKLVSPLVDSPLFRKHGRAVSIQLGVLEPNLLVFYNADNTYKTIAIGLPNLKTATHLDELTIVLRQRVDLQIIPVQFQVPISKPKSPKAKAKS